jgi:hypothetical protein
MKSGDMKRKSSSEVITSRLLAHTRDQAGSLNFNQDYLKGFMPINEEPIKDNLFLESISDIQRGAMNQIVETLNINSEDTSVLDLNNLNTLNNNFLKNILMSVNNNKSTNKTLTKIIITKFHDLYLKLVTQIKLLKTENSSLKRKNSSAIDGSISKQSAESQKESKENINNLNNTNSDAKENAENESEALKFLLQEELECFNQILFDFNLQFNELQSQEETLRRDILKKHKEIEKLNFDIEESKKQKDNFVKELQTIALKLNEYKLSVSMGDKSKAHQDSDHSSEERSVDEENINQNGSEYSKDDDDIEAEEFNLLMNAENREYLIKKILQENKKYKSIVKVMKTEEADFNNYLMQMEAELENFAKFKNFCLTKVNAVEENVIKCREKVDGLSDKLINLEFKLEINDDNGQ